MGNETVHLLLAVSLRIGMLKERLRSMGLDSDVKEACRLQGNIGALEQVQRWMMGKEPLPSMAEITGKPEES